MRNQNTTCIFINQEVVCIPCEKKDAQIMARELAFAIFQKLTTSVLCSEKYPACVRFWLKLLN